MLVKAQNTAVQFTVKPLRSNILRYQCALHKAPEWYFKVKKNKETGVQYYFVALRCGCSFVRSEGSEWLPWTYNCRRLSSKPIHYTNMLRNRQPVLVESEVDADCNVGSVQP